MARTSGESRLDDVNDSDADGKRRVLTVWGWIHAFWLIVGLGAVLWALYWFLFHAPFLKGFGAPLSEDFARELEVLDLARELGSEDFGRARELVEQFERGEDLRRLEGARRSLLTTVVVAASLGLVASAMTQFLKNILGLRAMFNERMVRRWLNPDPLPDVEVRADKKTEDGGVERPALLSSWWRRSWLWLSRAWRRIWHPATDALPKGDPVRRLLRSFDVTNRRGFFDLPIEQVCGQIGGAADIGLSMPRRDRELLALLTRGDGRTALSALLKSWPDEQGEQPGDPALESQARVAHHINHNIDALQIDVSYKWRLTVRLTSALLAGTFAFGLTGSVGLQGTNRLALFVFVALVGGFFAWFVRDLVAVVEKARLQP